MKIKKMQTYQAVLFNKQNETHFDVLNTRRFTGLEMELDKALNMVRISMPNCDTILVFPTNIAYIVPADAPAEVVAVKKVK